MQENNDQEEHVERPLECSECKKPIAVIYNEIVRNISTCTAMCADCPELQKRLFGSPSSEKKENHSGNTELECGSCGTTLEEVKRGHHLGCSECYVIFEDLILQELQNTQHLPARILSTKKSTPLNIGRAPTSKLAVNPSSRLLALNEALNDTLKRENYEQAALLRDQIKAITETNQQDERPKDQTDAST